MYITAGIPVIPMGETGIGKTASIDFLSKIMGYEYKKYDVHAGITKE